MTNTKAYPAYKDSGVEWLGEIPDHWEEKANKHVFSLMKSQVGKRSSQYDLLSLTLRGVIKRDMENPEGKFPAEFDTYQEVFPGDFVFCLFDVEETPRGVGMSPHEGMITGAYTVMRPRPGFHSRFLEYFYLNLDKDKRLRPLYRGLRNTIPKESFFGFKTFIPSPPEQRAIADFLDDKVSKIDRAIAQKERLIELLQERKQIIIQNAVTKGLDPSVKMKDSGIEWIGQIPEHWEVKRMRFICTTMKTGITPPTGNSQYFGGDVNWYNPGDLNNPFPKESEKTVTQKAVAEREAKLFPGDSTMIVGIGATCGKTAYLEQQATFNQQITGFRSETEHNRFLFYLLRNFADVMLNVANYTTLPILNNEFFKGFWLPLPSVSEQREIVKSIESVSTSFANSIDVAQSTIQTLREYKATLIDSAVTGKIDVRDYSTSS